MTRGAPPLASALDASSSMFFHTSDHDDSRSRLHQLAASFALDEAEVAFFDAVIAMLPATSTSFAELKHAYNECRQDMQLLAPIARTHALRASQGDATPSIDARLWNALLSLVQVRGHTWAERWDTIRVGLGREPLEEAKWAEQALEAPCPPSPSLAPPSPMLEDEAPMDAVHGSPAWSPLHLVDQRVPPRALDAVRWPRVSLETVLERRARDVERRHLRRYLERWNDKWFFCASRLERTAQAYAHWLALRAWGTWRDRHTAQRQASSLAAARAQHACGKRAFRAWRTLTEERVHARHKAQARTLRTAYLALEARRDARLARIALTLWTQAWQGHQASHRHRHALLPRAWDVWRGRMASLSALASKHTLFAAYMQRHLLGAAMDAWRQRVSERRCDTYLTVSAMQWNTQRLVRVAWRRWRASMAHRTTLYHWTAARERTMLQTYFQQWQWALRSARMAAHADVQRLRAAWHRWWVVYTDRTLARQAALLQLHDEAATRQRSRAWAQWRAKLAHWREQASIATRTSAWRQCHAAWHVWRHALQRRQQAAQLAVHHVDQRRLHAFFTQWRHMSRMRKADAYAALLQHDMLGQVFERTYTTLTLGWRWCTVRRRHWGTCAALVEAQRDAQAIHTAFARWRARTAEQVAHACTAAATHAHTLQRRYVRVWHLQRAKRRAQEAQAQAWYEERHATGDALVRALLRVWRSRVALRTSERAMSQQTKQHVWRRWRDALGEAQLGREELAALAARRHAILRACWRRWTQRTNSLPVLHLERAHHVRRALAHWRQRTRARTLPRLAKAFALSTVGADAMASWRHRIAHRQQVRALSYVYAR